MEDYGFCEEIINKYKVEELNSETLKYRFNKFVYACGMDLSDTLWDKDISSTRLSYIYKRKKDENINYDIKFARNYDQEYGPNFILIGEYNDLKLMFANYYEKDKRKDVVNEIPFRIVLSKKYKDATYQMEIMTTSNIRNKFLIKKNKESDMFPNVVVFQANIFDFGQILKLVKSFVYNPELVYRVYDEKINSKEVILSNSDLNAALVVDEKLDKPIRGIQKIIKKIIK